MGRIDGHVEYERYKRKSYSSENRKHLLDTIMNQLGITEEDLEKEPSWIKAKIRESKINQILK